MAWMTEQVKGAIAKLKAAGFKRSEFSVQVERKYIKGYRQANGRTAYEYGDAVVVLHCPLAQQIAMTDAILKAGLGVCHFVLDGKVRVVQVLTDYQMRGQFEVYDVRERARQAQEIIDRYDAKYGKA